jgi:diguanylate cyclase (GGDEF)-like protein
MKPRSIQFKFLITVIFAILAIAIFIGGLSIYEVDNYIQQQTEDLVKITCSNEAAQINDIFGDIVKSVRIMESYVLSLFENSSDIMNRDNQGEILELAGKMFGNVASNTDGALAYYLRFDPAISDGKTGMFYTKMNGSDEYISLVPTDLSLYDKNDTEHVGWFWQPYEAGTPIWLLPYYNQNSKLLMISYVIPLYFENQFIGVVGMDFDYTILRRRVHEIKVYENGFAHLEMDGVMIHNGNELQNHTHAGEPTEEYLRVSEKLDNGMTLVLSACYDDIKQIRYEIAYKILFIVILLALFFSMVVFFMVKKIVKPLRDLTNASIKLANGKYDVEISHSNTYEIAQLRTAFESMLVNLREHEELQNRLAYTDSLTGLRNTTSYLEWITNFNKKIQSGDISFGIVVLDLNYLKEANDTYGHIAGNALITGAARIISDIFKRSPVFRIGGDEFVVILQNRDLEECEALLAKFESECANAWAETEEVKLPISIAKGFSIFDPAKDTQISDVFDRADDEMYANKKIMKMAQI